jgi:hypothetical protein
MFKNIFKRKPTPAPVPPEATVHNPLDLGNGFTVDSVDDFMYKVLNVNIPSGSWISFKYAGREVFRIDGDGGRIIP